MTEKQLELEIEILFNAFLKTARKERDNDEFHELILEKFSKTFKIINKILIINFYSLNLKPQFLEKLYQNYSLLGFKNIIAATNKDLISKEEKQFMKQCGVYYIETHEFFDITQQKITKLLSNIKKGRR